MKLLIIFLIVAVILRESDSSKPNCVKIFAEYGQLSSREMAYQNRWGHSENPAHIQLENNINIWLSNNPNITIRNSGISSFGYFQYEC